MKEPERVEDSLSESMEGLSVMERLILLLVLLKRDGRPKQPRLRINRGFPTADLDWLDREVR